MAKKKRKSNKTLRRAADDLFSEVVRRSAADHNGNCTCVSCGKVKYWKGDGMHAGHYWVRGHYATRYDPVNVHPQCTYCNTNNPDRAKPYYAAWLIEEYGEEEFADLTRRAHTIVKQRTVMEEAIEWCKKQLKEMR